MKNSKNWESWCHPVRRTSFLRKIFKTPLYERARQVLGKGSGEMVRRLTAAYQASGYSETDIEVQIRKIIRRCKKLEHASPAEYVDACIRRETETNKLNKQFEADDEASPADLDHDLAALRGDLPGLSLAKRIGRERAMNLFHKLYVSGLFEIVDGRNLPHKMKTILLCAAKPTTRNPERYVDACIKVERNADAKSKRKRKRVPPLN